MTNPIKKCKDYYTKSVHDKIAMDADMVYSVVNFDGKLFIGVNDVPTIEIDDNMPAKDIVTMLNNLKENYIQFRKNEYSNKNI